MSITVPELTRDDVLAMTPDERVGLLRMMMPRIVEPYVPHAPHAPQALFLLDQGKEAFYGGAAGGGKSDALLMAALQYVDVPRYSALILRRTWGDLSQPGAIMERTEDWLGDTDAKPHDGGRYWTFPSGARLTFNFVQYPRDVTKFKSAEFQMIGWDELTNFTESSYTFMFSRLRRPALGCEDCPVKVEKVRPGQRSTSPAVRPDGTNYLIGGREVADETGWVHSVGQSNYKARCEHPAPARRALAEYPASGMNGHTTLFDVPLRMRSASNPGDVGHEWVRDRFVDAERRRRSATFYPARLTDNPSLDQASYEAGLSELDPVERQRLLDGDWDVAADGVMFKRSWFEVVSPDAVPAGCKLMRYWDFAATKVKTTGDKNDPDWTCGVLVGLFEGVWYIIDMVRIREDPHAVERTVASTASQDGSRVPIRIEQEPGSSGKITIDHYRRNVLVGYNVDKLRPTTAKEERARLWASAAGAGNVKIVGADWNRAFIDELAIFPYGTHDDQCLSGDAMVRTPSGVQRIDQTRPGDVVLGRSGWVTVTGAAMTSSAAVTTRRLGLRATAAHPVWTTRGWTPFAALRASDTLMLCLVLPTGAIETRLRPASACAATSANGAPLSVSDRSRTRIGAAWRTATRQAATSKASARSTTRDSNGTATPFTSKARSAALFASRRWSGTASPSVATPTHATPRTSATTSPAADGSSRVFRRSTKRSGSMLTGRSPRVTRSTTSTRTPRTTTSATSPASPWVSMRASMRTRALYAGARLSSSNIWSGYGRWPRTGTALRRGASGIVNTLLARGSERVEPVFNIATSDHTYFANDVLVHNCDAVSGAVECLVGKRPGRIIV